MEMATGLISSLLDITYVPVRQPQQIHSKHHCADPVLLFIPVLFADNTRC